MAAQLARPHKTSAREAIRREASLKVNEEPAQLHRMTAAQIISQSSALIQPSVSALSVTTPIAPQDEWNDGVDASVSPQDKDKGRTDVSVSPQDKGKDRADAPVVRQSNGRLSR